LQLLLVYEKRDFSGVLEKGSKETQNILKLRYLLSVA